MSTPTRQPKALVAMSGGVDSSVAAALMLREGWDVIGCFMRLGTPGETLDQLIPVDQAGCNPADARTRVKTSHRGCCSVGDAADARTVAAHLGIPLYVCNFKRDFDRIIGYFADEYASGRTPNPCVRCNDWLKFGKLFEYADSLGADVVVTGHYARAHAGRLRRGIDRQKDQSYVLFGLAPDRLARVRLPIGEMFKPDVRRMALELGLPVYDKPDSQEICFVPDDDYARLVESRRPELATAGAMVDTSGQMLAEHQGQHRFTIGQRRGLGSAFGRPLYVIERNADTNTVVLGNQQDLMVTSLCASEANWHITTPASGFWHPCFAQHRSKGIAGHARFRILPDSSNPTHSGRIARFELRYSEPQRAVAPGQAVVLYDDADLSLVLGGGWIESVHRADLQDRSGEASC